VQKTIAVRLMIVNQAARIIIVRPIEIVQKANRDHVQERDHEVARDRLTIGIVSRHRGKNLTNISRGIGLDRVRHRNTIIKKSNTRLVERFTLINGIHLNKYILYFLFK
jgi:hypothetical protein